MELFERFDVFGELSDGCSLFLDYCFLFSVFMLFLSYFLHILLKFLLSPFELLFTKIKELLLFSY